MWMRGESVGGDDRQVVKNVITCYKFLNRSTEDKWFLVKGRSQQLIFCFPDVGHHLCSKFLNFFERVDVRFDVWIPDSLVLEGQQCDE